jgi:hypothetical protein
VRNLAAAVDDRRSPVGLRRPEYLLPIPDDR